MGIKDTDTPSDGRDDATQRSTETGADAEGTDGEGTDGEGVDVEGTDAEGTDGEGVDVEGTHAEGANVEGTDDVRELLHLVTQETRFVLLQTVVAHPEGMPSLRELDYANTGKSKSTIRNHLDELVDHGVVETVALSREERSRDLPWTFYRLTDDGRAFLEDHELLAAEETLREMHSMLEKTDEIERYESAPRPDVGESEV